MDGDTLLPMMNIDKAIRQMRVARRLGKISNEQQERILRKRAGRNRFATWERMMALRASIEKEIAPILAAKREAERDLFQVKFEVA